MGGMGGGGMRMNMMGGNMGNHMNMGGMGRYARGNGTLIVKTILKSTIENKLNEIKGPICQFW